MVPTVYHRPYDPARPVGAHGDEQPYQLLGHVRSLAPGQART